MVKLSKVGNVSPDEDYKKVAMLDEYNRAETEASVPSPLETEISGIYLSGVMRTTALPLKKQQRMGSSFCVPFRNLRPGDSQMEFVAYY